MAIGVTYGGGASSDVGLNGSVSASKSSASRVEQMEGDMDYAEFGGAVPGVGAMSYKVSQGGGNAAESVFVSPAVASLRLPSVPAIPVQAGVGKETTKVLYSWKTKPLGEGLGEEGVPYF